MVFVAGIALAGLLWLDSRVEKSEPATASETGAAASPAVDDESEGFDLEKGLPRLEGILAEIEAEGQTYNFSVSMNELRHWFEKGARPLHPTMSYPKAASVGVSAPERMDVSDDDREGVRKGGNGAKCRSRGKWVYTHDLPLEGPEDGVSECWKRLSGSRTIFLPGPTIAMGHRSGDQWERRTWQPHNKRWVRYSEEAEASIRQYMIDEEYGTEAQWKDRESSRDQLKRILESPHYQENAEARISFIKMAILEAYKTRVMQAGAQYRLEYERNHWTE
jgi:hypothetical protein